MNLNKNLNRIFSHLEISIQKIFDSRKMIKIIYGRKWKKLEENQKEKLQLKFLDFLT